MEKRSNSKMAQPLRSRTARVLFDVLGTLFVGIGLVGAVLPLLPTTPFILLAAACYARGSGRFYAWLIHNRHLGPIIQEWRDYRSIPRKAKKKAIFAIVIVFSVSASFFLDRLYICIPFILLYTGLIVLLLRIPSRDTQFERCIVKMDKRPESLKLRRQLQHYSRGIWL